jgi:predicted GNAT family acetyltransferase
MTSAQLAPAQSAEVLWHEDKKHKGWTVHLHIGEEVIKYSHPDADRGTGDAELVSLAVQDARDDGYELNPAAVKITR